MRARRGHFRFEKIYGALIISTIIFPCRSFGEFLVSSNKPTPLQALLEALQTPSEIFRQRDPNQPALLEDINQLPLPEQAKQLLKEISTPSTDSMIKGGAKTLSEYPRLLTVLRTPVEQITEAKPTGLLLSRERVLGSLQKHPEYLESNLLRAALKVNPKTILCAASALSTVIGVEACKHLHSYYYALKMLEDQGASHWTSMEKYVREYFYEAQILPGFKLERWKEEFKSIWWKITISPEALYLELNDKGIEWLKDMQDYAMVLDHHEAEEKLLDEAKRVQRLLRMSPSSWDLADIQQAYVFKDMRELASNQVGKDWHPLTGLSLTPHRLREPLPAKVWDSIRHEITEIDSVSKDLGQQTARKTLIEVAMMLATEQFLRETWQALSRHQVESLTKHAFHVFLTYPTTPEKRRAVITSEDFSQVNRRDEWNAFGQSFAALLAEGLKHWAERPMQGSAEGLKWLDTQLELFSPPAVARNALHRLRDSFHQSVKQANQPSNLDIAQFLALRAAYHIGRLGDSEVGIGDEILKTAASLMVEDHERHRLFDRGDYTKWDYRLLRHIIFANCFPHEIRPNTYAIIDRELTKHLNAYERAASQNVVKSLPARLWEMFAYNKPPSN